MKKFTHKTTAPLGQHLLNNAHYAREVARESGAAKGVKVYEVGPGKGVLTRELLALGAKVVAVEKDPAMVAILKETFAPEIKAKK